jgi:hypothetical protein
MNNNINNSEGKFGLGYDATTSKIKNTNGNKNDEKFGEILNKSMKNKKRKNNEANNNHENFENEEEDHNGIIEDIVCSRTKIGNNKISTKKIKTNKKSEKITNEIFKIINDDDNKKIVTNKSEENLKAIPSSESVVVKRKRIKTRSKQKNIRKDNRPDGLKPEGLKIGNKNYIGRPITKVNFYF